jgi:hypothetical protein
MIILKALLLLSPQRLVNCANVFIRVLEIKNCAVKTGPYRNSIFVF